MRFPSWLGCLFDQRRINQEHQITFLMHFRDILSIKNRKMRYEIGRVNESSVGL
jgi:hypothetical protein